MGHGTALAALWPANADLAIAPVQENLDEGAARTGCLAEGALAPGLQPLMRWSGQSQLLMGSESERIST
jgi:hypothetical protein